MSAEGAKLAGVWNVSISYQCKQKPIPFMLQVNAGSVGNTYDVGTWSLWPGTVGHLTTGKVSSSGAWQLVNGTIALRSDAPNTPAVWIGSVNGYFISGFVAFAGVYANCWHAVKVSPLGPSATKAKQASARAGKKPKAKAGKKSTAKKKR